MNKPNYILFGVGGFPYKKSASGNKFFLMAKALLHRGFDVLMLNRYSIQETVKSDFGNVEGVSFKYLAGKKTRKKTLDKIIGEFKADLGLIQLLSERKTDQGNFLMISYMPLYRVLIYYILSKWMGYKLVISIMEYHRSLAKNPLKKLKANLFFNHAFKLADAALPISAFLQEKLQEKHPHLPLFTIPVLADCHAVSPVSYEKKKANPYFLYCGSIGYREVIHLVVKSFQMLNRQDVHLHLVLSGKEQSINTLRQDLTENRRIQFNQNLSSMKLYEMYAGATGLLIPMRPNSLQDISRFPQKAAEYAASASPVITNPVGEISRFFTNGENAFFAETFSIEAYCDAMAYILDNPKKAFKIGQQGRAMAVKSFHYESIAEPWYAFLQYLLKK